MANEFIIRKGFKSLQDSELTGSLNLSGNIVAGGTVEASFASSTSTAISGAFDSVSSSLSSRVADQESFSSSLDNTFATDSDLNLVSSSVDSINAATSSYALANQISGSTTSLSSSLASELLKNTTDTLTGDLTVTGTLTAQDLHVQEVTSSIVFSSGSNKFGTLSTDTQKFTGSLQVSGSGTFAGNVRISKDDATLEINNSSTGLTNADLYISVEDTGQADVRQYGTYPLAFWTNNVERMRIDSSGFVTIKNNPDTTNASLTLSNTDGTINVGQSIGYLNFYSNDNSTSSTGGIGGISVKAEEAFNTTFTPTYMSFYTHARTTNDGTFLGNVTERMRIRSSGTIGIGSDGFDSQMLTIAAGALDGAIYATSTDANCFASFRDNSSTANIEYGAIGDNHVFRKDATEQMRIDASGNVNIKLGNLSIGQSSEQNISNITGETWIGSNGLRYNSGSDTFARTSASSQAAMMVLTTTADVEFYTQPSTSTTGTYALTPKLVIKGLGNVGIGTASPDGKVHIFNGSNGATTVGTASDELILEDDTDCGLTIRSGATNTGVVSFASPTDHNVGQLYYNHNDDSMVIKTNDSIAVTVNSSQYVGIGTTSPNSPLTVHGQQRWYTTNNDGNELRGFFNPGGSGDSAELSLYQANGTSVGVELRATGNSFLNGGNVGIGTTSPAVKLHVVDTTTLVGAFASNSSTRTELAIDNTSTNNVRLGLKATPSGAIIDSTNHYGSNIQPLIFQVNASDKMRITSGGDIEVQGGDIFLNSGTNYNDKGVVYLSNERTAIISDIVNLTANGDTSLDFQTRKGGTRASAMFIDEFRNVGIGTTSPNATLEIGTPSGVAGSAGSVNRLFISPFSNTGGPYKFIARTVSGASDFLDMYYGPNHIISYGLDGKVGIGTTSPTTTLTVQGTTSNGINVMGVGTTATRCFLGLDSSNKGYVYVAGSSGENPAKITSYGDSYISTNLGIGTASPSGKLNVVASGNHLHLRAGTATAGKYWNFDITSNNELFIINNGGTGIQVNDSGQTKINGKTIVGTNTSYTSNTAGSFQMTSPSTINGGAVTTHSGGSYRYYSRVVQASTTANPAGYLHVKTNIPYAGSNVMYLAKFYGYAYGQSAIIDLQQCGYTYTSGPTATNQVNNGTNSGMSVGTYSSSTGSYLTFRVDFSGSTYYLGCWMDISMQNPTGGSHNFNIIDVTFNTASNHF